MTKRNRSAEAYGCIIEDVGPEERAARLARGDARRWRMVKPTLKGLSPHLDLGLAWTRCEKGPPKDSFCGNAKCDCDHEMGPWVPVVDVVLHTITAFVCECQDEGCGYYQVRQVPRASPPTEQEARDVGIIPPEERKPDYSKAPDWWGRTRERK